MTCRHTTTHRTAPVPTRTTTSVTSRTTTPVTSWTTGSARRTLAVLAVAVAALSGCSGSDDDALAATPTTPSTPTQTATTTTSPSGESPTLSGPTEPPAVGVRRTVATGLDVPWGLAFLPDGSALVAERDTGRIVRVRPGSPVEEVGTVEGVNEGGEGGLLGLAVPPAEATGGTLTVFAYFTGDDDNRIVSMPYTGGRLGRPTTVLTGIPSGGRHNGGRLAIGPRDGKLYVGTGEAGDEPLSQDRDNLGGKILRINLDGSTPPDNPFGTPVWSWGHRNVQGLAFDSTGQLWALEFGQNRFDELNRIQRGGNYGWPEVEGTGTGGGRFISPEVVWRTSEASPSGLAIVDDVAYVAGLGGERLWQVTLTGGVGEPVARFTEEYGRLRTVEPAPGGGLWLTTSNRDGRGNPADNDDRILQLRLG